jgi:hypothetical protein
MWSYADKNSYQAVLGDVVENYSKYQKMADKLKKWVSKEFEAEKQYNAFANAVLPAIEKAAEPQVVNFD